MQPNYRRILWPRAGCARSDEKRQLAARRSLVVLLARSEPVDGRMEQRDRRPRPSRSRSSCQPPRGPGGVGSAAAEVPLLTVGECELVRERSDLFAQRLVVVEQAAESLLQRSVACALAGRHALRGPLAQLLDLERADGRARTSKAACGENCEETHALRQRS